MLNLVDKHELARLLHVSQRTVLTWHLRGWIPALRAGRRPILFDVAAVYRALRARSGNGEGADHAQ